MDDLAIKQNVYGDQVSNTAPTLGGNASQLAGLAATFQELLKNVGNRLDVGLDAGDPRNGIVAATRGDDAAGHDADDDRPNDAERAARDDGARGDDVHRDHGGGERRDDGPRADTEAPRDRGDGGDTHRETAADGDAGTDGNHAAHGVGNRGDGAATQTGDGSGTAVAAAGTGQVVQGQAAQQVLDALNRDAELESGTHTFVWDGNNDFGVAQPDGTYNILVSGLDANGELLEIKHTVYGEVTGAGADGGIVTLTLGDDIEVLLENVLSVKETPPES